MAITGGCLCGAVRYELQGEPLFGGLCYCTDCRKTSSSHTAALAVPEAALKVTGELKRYAKPGGSGKNVARAFCPNCGTGIYSAGESRAGVVMLKVGTLDDTEIFKPMAAVYVSRAPSWDQPPAGMMAFPEMPPGQ